MSANIYTIESLLVGKIYRSKTLTGEIVSAEKSDVWYDNAEAYLVEVRDSLKGGYTFRTLAVRTND